MIVDGAKTVFKSVCKSETDRILLNTLNIEGVYVYITKRQDFCGNPMCPLFCTWDSQPLRSDSRLS